MVGGMVWCITSCNHTIDVDLFYSESATIGQKIALTEKVVEVLPQLKCPHTIEPHQIQGLDCIHIFPVVQWLVREAVYAKELYGDNVRNHAMYHFSHRFRFSKEKSKDNQKSIFSTNCRKIRVNCIPQRIYRRKDDIKSLNLRADVRYTLLEYGWFVVGFFKKVPHDVTVQKDVTDEERKELNGSLEIDEFLPQLSEMDISLEQQRFSVKTLARVIDVSEFHTEEQLKEKEERLDNSLKMLEKNKQMQVLEIDEIDKRIADYEHLINESDEDTLNKLKHLLIEHDEIARREADFKAICRNKLGELDKEIEMLQAFDPAVEEFDVTFDENEAIKLRERMANLRIELGQLNQQIAAERRIRDSIPAQIETSQYHRRIIELYNQIACKHRETKQFYILHNTLVDIKTFMNKEIDLLNSMDDVYDFVCVMFLPRVVQQVSTKLERLQTRKDKLNEEYQYMLDRERLYYKKVEDFKNACHENEELKRRIEDKHHPFIIRHCAQFNLRSMYQGMHQFNFRHVICRMELMRFKRTPLEAELRFSNNFKNFCEGVPCKLGIDEAGRGPVLGPMVYACTVIMLDKDDVLRDIGVNDSKLLTETKREKIFNEMNNKSKVHNSFDMYFLVIGYAYRVLSAQMISAAMLRRTKYSLNELSHDCAVELMKLALDSDINVVEAYVDTVGPRASYQSMLKKKFPSVQITVSEKADLKFPVVGAASIVAKVTFFKCFTRVKRDEILKNWVFPEGIDVPSCGHGSGYPTDPKTKNFLKEVFDPVFGYPNLVRFSWKTVEVIMQKRAMKCQWGKLENTSTKTITSFFKPCFVGKNCESAKNSFLADRHLSNVTDCSDF
ncbi:unnamed protein product [Thelazia callipaeda]|uniref:Ribonuclease n=1 Tax=Thelazia callipaeda TaxID=103827 RepID=A0A0N5D2U3_THECL|nr:unnamed protein product [Thelazia callipaeda]